jgi:hypothetical protein
VKREKKRQEGDSGGRFEQTDGRRGGVWKGRKERKDRREHTICH